MKLFRTLVTALAALIVAGTVASAAPSLRDALEPEPTPEASVTTPTEPTESPSSSSGTSETVPPEGETEGEGTSVAADFAACEGRTGLENAICRHEALLAAQPENLGLKRDLGLQNALTQLLLNQAKHTEEVVEEPTGEAEGESETTETTSSCPGKSCEPHGNGKGHSPH